MTVIVRRIPGSKVDQLEKLINEFLAKEDGKNCELASTFVSPDGESVVLIFNKKA
ncbi:MAG: hypothetical protein LDL31_05455 [Prosthecobacter sp.]|jgi:hypothetical protein|nr:hypothetical protein [Prosthecobacter sp.]